MTKVEENIVNIAMRAGELIQAGKIESDEISGFIGLTETIVELAHLFEKQNDGVDFGAEGRDYWLEIDAFAETNLVQCLGREVDTPSQDLSDGELSGPEDPIVPHLYTCCADQEFLFLVRAVNLADAEKTGEAWYTKTFFEPGHFSCWVTDKKDLNSLATEHTVESAAYQKFMAEHEAQQKAPLNDQIASAAVRSAGQEKHKENRSGFTDRTQ